MKNFFRAIGIINRYRGSLMGLAFAAIMVAVFWTVNFGMVYPIVGVVLKQHSLRDWVDENIQTSEVRIVDLESKLNRWAASANSPSEYKVRKTQSLLQAEKTALANSRQMRPWIYRYMPDRPFPTLVLVVTGLMVGTLLKTLFLIMSVILVERLTQLVALDLRKTLFRNTIRMNLSHFGDDRTSELVSRFTHDMDAVAAGAKTMFGRALREPLKVIACLAGSAFVCWRLLVFCLLLTPVAIYLINRLAGSVKRANRRAMTEMASVYGHLSETFNGIQAVKAFTMERSERRKMHHLSKEYFRKSLRIAVYHALAKPCTELMSIGVVCVAILAGGYLVLEGETHLLGIRMCNRPLSFEALMTFFVLLAGVSDPFRKLADVYNQIQRGAAAADRIYALVDRKPDVRNREPAIESLPPLDSISLQNVHFAYSDGKPVLKGIDLEVTHGQRFAIVGPNGCGKSTLIKLLPRFYEPQVGSIQWNDIELRNLHLKRLREKISLVSQESFLFDASVAENIRYGNPSATDLQVRAAATKAHADTFIMQKLANGYDTIVGQSGNLLSGGQRQRIALARAILRDPDILILDEATSQIDIESEQLIHQALEEFTAGRTTFMITHRLSTLAIADKIVVMDAGLVVDQGRHDELLDRCELYQRLHQIQFRRSA